MSLVYEKINEAYRLIKENSIEEALEMLNEAEYNLGKDEFVEDLYILKGSIYLHLKKIDLAKSTFEKVLEENNSSAEACIGLAKVFLMEDNLESAKAMYELAVQIDPDNTQAKQNLETITKLIENLPPEEEANLNDLFEMAYDNFLNNKFEETLDNIDEIEKKYIEEINLLRGNTFLSLDFLDKAKEAFEKVLEVNKKSSEASNGLAEVFFKKGMYEDAKTMYEFSLEINHDDQFAMVGLAKVNDALDLAPVHQQSKFVVDDKSNELNMNINKAYELFNSKKFNESNDILEELLNESELDNNTKASILNMKGFNYLGLNEVEKAKEQFEKALELNSLSSQACAGLGEVFYLLEDDESAKTMFEWGVKNNPKNQFAINGLAKVNSSLGLSEDHNRLDFGLEDDKINDFQKYLTDAYKLYSEKKYEEALSCIEKAETKVDFDTTNKNARRTISGLSNFKGFVLLALSKNDIAKEAFERGLKFNPNSSQACAGLAELLYLEGKDQEAKEMFEWALKNDSGNVFAKEGLKKVNKLLELPEDDNSLDNVNYTEISEKINSIISEGYSLFENKKFNDSLEKLEKAEDLIHEFFKENDKTTTLSSLYNFKGFNYLSLNNNIKAEECFKKSLEYNPSSSQGYAGLAEVLFLNGQDKEAKENFSKALEFNAQNQFAISGLNKVNAALGIDSMEV